MTYVYRYALYTLIMGVHGLWQLLNPLGRPISLESLENKVLAVDASIWIHQAVSGFRDKNGSPLPNAHLIGTFHRLCKLLFYGIKPIFIFDGKVPLLKRETMAARRELRNNARRDAEKSQKQILTKQLKLRAVQEVLSDKDLPETCRPKKDIASPKKIPPTMSTFTDLFQLPTLPDPSSAISSLNLAVSSEEDDSDLDDSTTDRSMAFTYQDLDNVDVDSDDFKALPLEIQHELLVDLKERSRRRSWTRLCAMPDNPEEIGSHQIRQLLSRRKLQQRLDDVSKRLRSSLAEQMSISLNGEYEEFSADRMAEVRRIVSEDSAHYILFRNVQKAGSNVSQLDSSKLELATSKSMSTGENSYNQSQKPVITKETAKEISAKREDNGGVFEHVVSHVSEHVVPNSLVSPDESIASVTDSLNYSNEMNICGNDTYFKESHTQEVLLSKQGVKDVTETAETFDIAEVPNEEKSVAISALIEFHDVKLTEKQPERCAEEERNGSKCDKDLEFCSAETGDFKIQSTAPALLVKPGVVDIADSGDDDDDFVEVRSLPQSPTNFEELFPLDVFQGKKNEDFVHEIHKRDLSPTTVPSSPFGSKPSMEREDLIELSKQLEQEVETLVQDRGRQERVAAKISDHMYVEIQELLKYFGVPYVISPSEAEAQCATLDILGLTEGTITDDSDIWLFGGRRVYKNFFNQDRDVMFFKDVDVRERLGLDRRKLVAVALLAGGDYTDGVKGVGVVSALEILGEFADDDGIVSLRKLRAWWDETRWQTVAPSETKIKKALRALTLRDGFPSAGVVDAYMNPGVDESTEPFSWSHPDLDELRHFARSKLGWTKDKLDGVLLPVIKKLNAKGRQTHMSDYFQPTTAEASTSNAGHSSRRLQRAVKRVLGGGDPNKSMAAVARKVSQPPPKRGRTSRRIRSKRTACSRENAAVVNLSSSSSGEEYRP